MTQKTLIIAEKPSVARDIAKAIINGKSTSKDGYIEGGKHIISWAIGHLVTLCDPEDYDVKLKRWNMGHLPICPESFRLKPVKTTKKQLEIVKHLMQRPDVDELVCATDAGREGELIFRYIYHLAKCNKPFKRLWISSMTEEAIKKGFAQLKPGTDYDPLYESARCRSEADWLIGINGTRAYTTKNNTIYSVGRVQTPTLAMLVERDRQIENFTPEDYWEVKSIYEDFQGTWIDLSLKENSTKISSKDEAEKIANLVKGTTGKVTELKKEKKKQPPPLLYDLTELQRDGNKYFGYTAKQTLDIAQALYEKHKLITYPRTDSRYLSTDMKPAVKDTIQKLKQSTYNEWIEPITGTMKFTARIINDKKVTDHHACIPTPRIPNLQRLNDKEKNIYELVAKRLISVFYPPHVFETTTVLVETESHTFQSKGKVIVDAGWKHVYNKSVEKKNSDSEQQLPALKKGNAVQFVDTEILTKQTQPPKPYTESTLLSAMENAGRQVEDEELKEQLKDSGLGTPATRASIIERLIQVGYVERNKKSLQPTAKGIAIIEAVPQELQSPEMTGKWERALNKMAKGNFSSERFMESINRFAAYIVQEAKKSKPIK
ncbi:DNA topoisomerase III [Desulfuribacillus alkaliarsenatis]|uniref:DNA topoisomerase n=1 Tax=Desulfuribacillus alkaliarsenatis TaxID=766136 RepID=A0A1E5G141_9FIRM|nr:DNA topoisomerase III [Desulfuribacillus alkaliarsenatis]OEF96581.1 hypothetical protein BHF68_08010 [Desulfuribacillus alkaliarsenatis]